MSDDQQTAVPVNRPDDCSTEQPPKDDAAAAVCPVQPPKKDASPPSPPKEDANPAPPPMDDITAPAGPSPLPLDETVPSVPRVEPELSVANSLENADRVQVEHDIKHETIDLGNDTYYYNNDDKDDGDNNDDGDDGGNDGGDDNDDGDDGGDGGDGGDEEEEQEPVGFDRGLEPDHIIGATEVNGKLMFLIAWKNAEIADLLESTEVYNRCPQLAIRFFEPRLTFQQRN